MRVQELEDSVRVCVLKAQDFGDAAELVGLHTAWMLQLHDALCCEASEQALGVFKLLGRGKSTNPPIKLDEQYGGLGVKLKK
eukprot:CAMPEP_0115256910 /NCGR_PEP_ID=MMETSP0270-20121206/46494_1 /TAXON_ID=71861 /ORGANISM="Scrippsiella trochoidea, Strain CCMP3099" /LENGTH=81 /DNA_ID=CAMNT_0002672587 /DNA_START=356 /DNA_END=601 /DNA_ORIENTATION=-